MDEMPGSDLDDEITIRLSGELLRAVDRFIEENEETETRPQAVLSALREWALAEGYLNELGEEGIRPEDLSAANDG